MEIAVTAFHLRVQSGLSVPKCVARRGQYETGFVAPALLFGRATFLLCNQDRSTNNQCEKQKNPEGASLRLSRVIL
jgi:hypothetical protein